VPLQHDTINLKGIIHFRAIATRYNKFKRYYTSMVTMACSFIGVSM